MSRTNDTQNNAFFVPSEQNNAVNEPQNYKALWGREASEQFGMMLEVQPSGLRLPGMLSRRSNTTAA